MDDMSKYGHVVETKCFGTTATKLVMSVFSTACRKFACVILLSKRDEGMLSRCLGFPWYNQERL